MIGGLQVKAGSLRLTGERLAAAFPEIGCAKLEGVAGKFCCVFELQQSVVGKITELLTGDRHYTAVIGDIGGKPMVGIFLLGLLFYPATTLSVLEVQ